MVWLAGALTLATPAAAQETGEDPPTIDVGDLTAEPDLWDGRRIVIEGEPVGDYSEREDGVWVQVNDDAYVEAPVAGGGEPVGANVGVGARLPHDVFSRVEGPPGRYGMVGPVVRLVGTFRWNDPLHTGETFLDVEQMSTLRRATPYPTPGPDAWLLVGVGSIGLALALAVRVRRRRRGDGRLVS
jgi:hypothetical protein